MSMSVMSPVSVTSVTSIESVTSSSSEASMSYTIDIKKFENNEGINNPPKQNLKRYNYDNLPSWLISGYKIDKKKLFDKNEINKSRCKRSILNQGCSILLTFEEVCEIEKKRAKRVQYY